MSLMRPCSLPGGALMLAVRSTRKVSGRAAAATSTMPMAATVMKAMVLIIAALRHPDLLEAILGLRARQALEVFHLVELAHLDLRRLALPHRVREAACPLQRLGTAARLDEG